MADSNPVPSERGRVGITIRSNENIVPAALVIMVPCSWRGGSRTSASGGGGAASWPGPGTRCCTRRRGPPCTSAWPCAAPWPGADTSPGHSTSWGTPPAACSGQHQLAPTSTSQHQSALTALSSAPASPCLSAGRGRARACAWVARCAAPRAPRSSSTRTGWG